MFSLWFIHITQAVCLTCSLLLLPSEFTLNHGSLSKHSSKRLYVLVHQFHNRVFLQLHRYSYLIPILHLMCGSAVLFKNLGISYNRYLSMCHGLLQQLLCMSWKNLTMSCKSRVLLCPEEFLWVQFEAWTCHWETWFRRKEWKWTVFLWTYVAVMMWSLVEQYFHTRIVIKWHGCHRIVRPKTRWTMWPLDGSGGDHYKTWEIREVQILGVTTILLWLNLKWRSRHIKA